jgi:uncharacterized membrane protein
MRTTLFAPALGLIFACYIAARMLEVFAGPVSGQVSSPVPQLPIVALDVLSALCFALIDGSRRNGLRTFLVFAAICIVIGNSIENLGVATGFPYGRYEFLQLMGPKLFHVPILLGLAYIGMAWVSWQVAQAILQLPAPLTAAPTGLRILALPAVASFVMVAWDLAQDPVWATILHGWDWHEGGPWFGVPVSNYLGWYLNVFLIYTCFALYQRHALQPARPEPSLWPRLAFYALCAAGNVLQLFSPSVRLIVHDPAGTPWRTSDILAASAIVSIFVMGGFAAIAAARIASSRHEPTGGKARD